MPKGHSVLTVLLLLALSPLALAGERQQQVPAHFWTQAEEKEYQACLPESLEVWKKQKAAEDYCLIHEEHTHWLRKHPQVAGKEEIKGVMQECLKRNEAKINGTWAEFRAAFDGCMRKAYGLK